MKNQVAKTLVGLNDAQIAAKRLAKKEASQRCRARQKALASGSVPTADLAIRSMQPKAFSLEKMRLVLADGTVVRASKNGGEKVAFRFSHPDGSVTRKGFANMDAAKKAYKALTK